MEILCLICMMFFQEYIPDIKWNLPVLTFGTTSKRSTGWNTLDMTGMIFMPNVMKVWSNIYKNGKGLVYWSDFKDPGLYCLGSIFHTDFYSFILWMSLFTSLNFGFDVRFLFIRNSFLAFDWSNRMKFELCKNS